MRITVAICTWNRAALLNRTLNAMSTLFAPPGVDWEIVVVDNSSTDATKAVIAEHARKLPVRYALEERQGLSYARNRAISCATGKLILWTDDDVIVDEHWLSEYARAAERYPDAAFFGGTIQPWYEVTPPPWIAKNIRRFEGALAIRELAPDVRILPADEFAFGANMAVWTEVARTHAFRTDLGRRGADLISAEEVEFQSRLRSAGHIGVWVGTAKVRHFVPAHRLTKDYMRRWFYAGGRSDVRMQGVAPGTPLLGDVPRYAVRGLWQARFKLPVLALFRNRAWVSAFRDAAHYRGVLDEARAIRPSSVAKGRTGNAIELPS